MVSDDERRKVARRLREIGYTRTNDSMIFAYIDALDIEGYADWVVIANRLADFIEPAQDHFGDSDKKVDHDALLALADELDSCIIEAFDYGKLERYSGNRMARRIREALGVSENNGD